MSDLLRVLIPCSDHSGDAGRFFPVPDADEFSSSLSGLEWLESSCGGGGLSHQS